MPRIVLLPGDGIGPEVTAEAVPASPCSPPAAISASTFETHDFGGVAIDRHGDAAAARRRSPPAATPTRSCSARSAGRNGTAPRNGPKPACSRLRAALGLFANLRPGGAIAGLEELSPLKPEIARGADILVVRELTGGALFRREEPGRRQRLATSASTPAPRSSGSPMSPSPPRAAAPARVTSVDKANVLATSKLWRKVVTEVAAHYPDVALDHLYVDAAAMALVTNPRRFDVILTENMFGDILSDELAVIGGSIGLLGSASLGARGPGLFEPIHGSAPDIAGLDIANPAGAIAARGDAARPCARPAGHGAHPRRGGGAHPARRRAAPPISAATARCSEFGARVREHLDARLGKRDALLELIAMNRGCCG